LTTSTVALAPNTNPVLGAGASAETPTLSPRLAPSAFFGVTAQAIDRAGREDYPQWLSHIRAAGGCTRPIRLAGQTTTRDSATGALLSTVDTTSMPDGAIYKACGNRRGAVCPHCAEVYRRDAYQVLRAGMVGGKGVPETVAGHDAAFVTFTAPSFGPVHTRVVRNHTCTDRRRCDCRPDPCRARQDRAVCQHGHATVCFARHDQTDPRLGTPLCLDCYDHDHQVVWNLWAGELWRRTKQAIERRLNRLCRRHRLPGRVRVSHGKAAEFQVRGAVHFHALLRLDGYDKDNPDLILPPPAGITAADLDDAVKHAAATVTCHSDPHPARLDAHGEPTGWRIGWGEQVDIRLITMRGHGEVTDEMAAGYLAKYATKSTEITGHVSGRLDADTIGQYADPDGDHAARLIDACWRLGAATHTPDKKLSERPRSPRPATSLGERWTCDGCGHQTRLRECPRCLTAEPAAPTGSDTYVSKVVPHAYARLRRWAHMLGFGGHFLTKARRYSVTFRVLREARITWRREEDRAAADAGQFDTAEHLDEETTLVVGHFTFAGAGWRTNGDALLATTAAAKAREYARTAREELAHEIGSEVTRNAANAA